MFELRWVFRKGRWGREGSMCGHRWLLADWPSILCSGLCRKHPTNQPDRVGFLPTCVDLNPVRAKIADGVSKSKHTGVKRRYRAISKDPNKATQRLLPLSGYASSHCPKVTEADYIDLVDLTGRTIAPGKRGKINTHEPTALTKLGLNRAHWTAKVKDIRQRISARDCSSGRLRGACQRMAAALGVWRGICPRLEANFKR
jgi:hypothetical protein